MCLAIPCQIVEIVDDATDIAKIEVSGVRRNINIGLVKQDGAQIGDWVLVHVGFALSLIDEEEANRTLDFLESLDSDIEDEWPLQPDSSGAES